MEAMGTEKFRFGEYELDPASRTLLRAGQRVEMYSKAFDLLCELVRNHDRVVSKDELLETVWPDQIVEENNLTVQMSALRKIFSGQSGAARYIATVPGQGYKFVAELEAGGDDVIIENRTFERIVVEHDEGDAEPLQLVGSRRSRWPIYAIAAVLLAAAGAGIWWWRASATPVRIESIAVLPFDYQGSRSDADYLSDGVTESLINNLSQLPNLTVKARSSVFKFKGQDMTPQNIASQLGVQAVLLGKIVETGDGLALSIEVVNAATGDQVWGQRYERKLTDIASLTNEIASDVAGKLRLRLGAGPVARGQTKDSEAYELYLRGRFLWNKRQQKDHEVALELFEKAIARDPNFALAYSAIADVCVVDSYKPPEGVDCDEKGRKFAAKALEIDPQLSDPYAALASFDWSRRDWQKADENFRKAIELNPNNGMAHHWRSEMLLRLRRPDEAIAEMKTALLIDPVSQVFNNDYAYILVYSRRYEEGLAQARRANEMSADWGWDTIVFANEYLERYGDALDATLGHPISGDKKDPENVALWNQKVEKLRARFQKEGPIGYWKGLAAETEEYNATNAKKQYVLLSICYTKTGEYDKALDMLEKSIDAHEGGVDLSFAEPHFDPLREMPRYKALMKRLGFDAG